jgi:outer membrane protein OmpA-like peptidoglycan-associated protein
LINRKNLLQTPEKTCFSGFFSLDSAPAFLPFFAKALTLGTQMNNKHSNAALAILFSGALIVSPSLAQTATSDPGKPTPGAALNYHGGDTRIGLGWDSELDARGEIFQVFQSSDTSATLGELWAAKRSGGVKLSHNWANAGKTSVTKVFGAFDVTDSDYRKFTLGGGQEYRNWYWNTYVSKGIGGDNKIVDVTVTTPGFVTGRDAGGDFRQDYSVAQNAKLFTRAFDWGVGGRVGHFYTGPLLRLTAGLDYEWGKARSSRTCTNVTVAGATTAVPSCETATGLGGKPSQLTGSVMLEKFFEGSGFSVALSGEALRRKGQLVDDRSDTRGTLMLRYEFGAPKSNFRPSKLTKTVVSTERVPDPNWVPPPPAPAPVAAAPVPAPTAAPVPPQFRTETRTSRFNTNDAQETYFDLGSAKLKPAAMRELDALVARINGQQPYVELRVRIIGHTCPTGSDRNNFPLSQKRADAVKAYLVSKGVPTSVINTDAKAGKSPKYPEVKGQSFRNRRADTEVEIVKERSEQVQVPVAAPAPAAAAPAAATPATPPAPPPQRPMIDRQVSREVIEDQPDPWIARALRNSVPHKTYVDTYTWSSTTQTTTLGAKTYLNRGPSAVNDSVSATCGTPLTINVLGNDTDPDGDTLTITSVSTPGKGTAVISGRTIIYTPAAGAGCTGSDTFTYTISDGKGGTSTATVTAALTAAPVPNDPPQARDDTYVLGCSAGQPPKVYDVLANDTDPNGDALTITAITQPSLGGTVAISGSGKTVTFTPTACFTRTTFTYTISDGKGGTSTATVTLVDPI